MWHGGKEYVEGGFTTRAAAEKALANMRRRLESARLGEVPQTPRYDPTIRALLGDPDNPEPGTFLDWLSMPGNKAPSYVRRSRTACRALLPFFGDRRVSELTADLVAEYQRLRLGTPLRLGEAVREAARARREALGLPPLPTKRPGKVRTVTPSCVNREVMTLKAALSWASDPTRDPARRLDRDPLQKVPMLREPEARNPTLTAEDEARLLAACSPPWLRELVEMLLATGLRPGEALALQWSDLNPDQRVLVVRHSKSNRSRLVPVPARVLDMLLARRPGTRADGLVFTSRTGKAISVEKAGHHFRRVAGRVGLQGFTLHCLRHVHATRLLSAGASLPQVASVLGHSSLHTSTRYAHPRLPDLQRLVDEVAARSARQRLSLVKEDGEA